MGLAAAIPLFSWEGNDILDSPGPDCCPQVLMPKAFANPSPGQRPGIENALINGAL